MQCEFGPFSWTKENRHIHNWLWGRVGFINLSVPVPLLCPSLSSLFFPPFLCPSPSSLSFSPLPCPSPPFPVCLPPSLSVSPLPCPSPPFPVHLPHSLSISPVPCPSSPFPVHLPPSLSICWVMVAKFTSLRLPAAVAHLRRDPKQEAFPEATMRGLDPLMTSEKSILLTEDQWPWKFIIKGFGPWMALPNKKLYRGIRNRGEEKMYANAVLSPAFSTSSML